MTTTSSSRNKGGEGKPSLLLSIARKFIRVWDGLIMDQTEEGAFRRKRFSYSVLGIAAVISLAAAPGGLRQLRGILAFIAFYGTLTWLACLGVKRLRKWEKEQKRKSGRLWE